MKSRRKFSNLFIDAGPQLRLFIPFAVLFFWSFFTVFLMYRQIDTGLMPEGSLTGDDLLVHQKLTEIGHGVLRVAIAGLVGLGVLSVGLWIVFSHRIFGPVVPIRRRLQQLSRGEQGEPIRLRKGDELKGLADDVNALGGGDSSRRS